MTGRSGDQDHDEREALESVKDELDALRRRHAGDPPVDLLRAAKGGALPEDLQNEAERHLVDSAWSRALVDGLEDADAVLSRDDEDRILARIKKAAPISEPRERSRVQRWLPAFAAAAAAAIVSTIWIGSRGPVPVSTPVQPGPPAVAPVPLPVFELPLEKPEMKLSLGALTWRGAGSENQYLSDLKPAVDAFRAGDYAAANRAFAGLTARYPRSIEILFYQGVSRLFLNDARGAIERLSEAERIADRTFNSDVAWYRAVAEQRAGNPAGAVEGGRG